MRQTTCNPHGRTALFPGSSQEAAMRNRFAIAALMLTCFAVAPGARAQTYGLGAPMVTVDEARDIAVMNGVIYIRKIEFDDGVWKVKGRDEAGRRVEMEIDPRTGDIAQLERFD
jgi:hypothetical protein